MKSPQYVWQRRGWPRWSWDEARLSVAVSAARRAQGVVEGMLRAIGFTERQELAAEAWAQEAVSTAAIEGEQLDLLTVRSSVARRLGTVDHKGPHAPRQVDGLLDIMDDAVTRSHEPLTNERLFAWQAALFPTGYSGMRRVRTGSYREGGDPMQIVSGRANHEVVHYEAPASAQVPAEMARFLDWFNSPQADPLLHAATAHLWFETIHPFEDGNGRVGRAIIDLALARDAGEISRLVRISQRLLEKRDEYYDELHRAQHGDLDVTQWTLWFVDQVRVAWDKAALVVQASLEKARFWTLHANKPLSARQRKAVNAMLDRGPGGFEGGMSTRKYEALTSAARATASRDLIELDALGVLKQVGSGRSTRYYVNLDGWLPQE
jgi:Fic family protein